MTRLIKDFLFGSRAQWVEWLELPTFRVSALGTSYFKKMAVQVRVLEIRLVSRQKKATCKFSRSFSEAVNSDHEVCARRAIGD